MYGVDAVLSNIMRTLPDANLVPTSLPLCPELKLYLIDPANMQRPFGTEEIGIILANTPYWIFCWASGHALAHYVLCHPELVAGKYIVDFGAGSGVVAIAAAMAGAARVIACDIDPDAIVAVEANAALNQVSVATCRSLAEVAAAPDLMIAADVLYDRENFHYLEELPHLAKEVWVADSRIKAIDLAPYRRIAEITATTLPDLDESEEFSRVKIYRNRRP